MSRLWALAVVAAVTGACGRSSGGLQQYAVPDAGPTLARGTLRAPNDIAPRRGRIVVTANGQKAAVSASDDGSFDVELAGAGTVHYVAVDDDGNAAHGEWVVQANGVNAVGRVWLSTLAASPWLVAERGLGFEERLTDFQLGVANTGSLEVVGTGLWYVGPQGIAEWNLATSESTEVLALDYPSTASFGWVPRVDDRDEPCWAMEVRQSNSFALFDVERRKLVATQSVTAASWARLTDEGVIGVACEGDHVTFIHFKGAPDQTSTTLTTWRYTRGAAEPSVLGQVTLAPVNQGGLEDGYALSQATGRSAVFLKRTLTDSGRLYEMARWDLQSPTVEQLGAAATFTSTMSEDGLTWLDDLGDDVTLTDARSGEKTVLTSVKAQQTTDTFSMVDHVPSAQRRFAVYWAVTYQRIADHSVDLFPILGLRLWRLDLRTRAVTPLPLPNAVSDLLGQRFDFEAAVTDDGVATVVARPAEAGQAVIANLTAPWVSTFETTPKAMRALVFGGPTLALVEKRALPDSASYETSNAVFTGKPGEPLKRRTFLGGAAGATRRDGDVLYSIRRDPLSGFSQLFRLGL